MTAEAQPPEDETGEVQTKPFPAVLQEINDGKLVAELSTTLQDVTAAVLDTGKAGSLTVVLKFKRAGDMVHMEHEIKARKPESRASTLFFVDAHMNLVRNNPNQPQLPLTVVADDTTKKPLTEAK